MSSTPIRAVQDGCRAVSASSRDPVEDLLVGLDRRPGRELAVVERRERRLVEDVAGRPDGLDPLARSFSRGQVVELQRRVLARVARRDPHASRGCRSTSGRCAPGSRGPSAGARAVVPDRDRQEVEHQVRVVDVVVAAEKPPPSKWLVAPRPLRRNSHSAPIRGRLRQRSPGAIETGCLRGVLDVDLEVVLQVLADPGRSCDDVDAEPARGAPGRPDAGELQQLRGVDRAAAEDDLAGLDACGWSRPPRR